MKLKKRILSVALVSLFLQGCALTHPPLPDPDPIENKLDLRTDWRRGVDGGFGESSERFTIVPKGEHIYFTTQTGVVYKLRKNSGSRIDSFDTGFDVSAGIAMNEETVYLGTYDAELVSVSLKDEKVLWKKLLTSEILSEPAQAANKLAVQTSDGWLSLLNANTGDTLWRIKEDLPDLTVRGTSSPVIQAGKVIVGFSSGKIKAFGLLNGQEQWSFEVGKPTGRYEIERLSDVDGRLVIENGIVYATAYNGTVTAVNLSNGRLLWQRSIPSALSVAIQDDTLVVVDLESRVFGLNALNGSELWNQDSLKGRDLSSPVFLRDHVAVIDRAGYVSLLNKQSGDVDARELADLNLPPGSRMVSDGQQLFILTRNEQVTALTY
ncbi:outer membrane protein assembly factor BamB [Marinomonas sp. 2405UD68-3]|uniref:outer membrane protein assembly factor BamB n=1 Tax=Marinomonas sp. 2405UD68-3 TaxID=3391835 RepID=UPI0039C98672